MTLPKEESDALRRCLAILAPLHGPHERRTMALKIEQRIKGESTSLLPLRFTQLGALFYPKNKEKSLEVAQQMQVAADAGELTTIIPASEKGAMFSDLAAWPDCPPIPEESPLRYWLPDMPTPAQSPTTPAPVVEVGASGGVVTEKAAPVDKTPWLAVDPKDPVAEHHWYTPARYFARQLVRSDSTLLNKKLVLADKVSQSLYSAGIYKRGGKKRHDASTVLKAFSNMTWG